MLVLEAESFVEDYLVFLCPKFEAWAPSNFVGFAVCRLEAERPMDARVMRVISFFWYRQYFDLFPALRKVVVFQRVVK